MGKPKQKGQANKGKARTGNRVNSTGHSLNVDRQRTGDGMRDKSTIRRLQMYRNFKPKRDKTGKIVKAAPFQSTLPSGTVARIAPNRKWFGNTRVITQSNLQSFQDEMAKVSQDPYQVVMRRTKLPITLLNSKAKNSRVHILDTESFEETFSQKRRRKRPRLQCEDVSALAASAEARGEAYEAEKDSSLPRDDDGVRQLVSEPIFRAGQSKRVWNELYKVLDSSDVLLYVLDARDPIGTRSPHLERYLKTRKPIIFILNKVDLVPVPVTKRWKVLLSREYPTLAFHASMRNPFGKGALIGLLRQFGRLHSDKKQIAVGVIGYPNVGKSSIINTLRSKLVCKVAPIAGETKVWQYVTLMRRIHLIDCPGVVYPTGDSEADLVLKGVIRVEYLRQPELYADAVLARVRPEHLARQYSVSDWTDTEGFLEQLARQAGKLLKGGEPDLACVAKMLLNDFQRGRLPHYAQPPDVPLTDAERLALERKSKTETAAAADAAATDEAVEGLTEQTVAKPEAASEADAATSSEDDDDAAIIVEEAEEEQASDEGVCDADSPEAEKKPDRDSEANSAKPASSRAKQPMQNRRSVPDFLPSFLSLMQHSGADVEQQQPTEGAEQPTEGAEQSATPQWEQRRLTKLAKAKLRKAKASGTAGAAAAGKGATTSRERRRAERDQRPKKVGEHFYTWANVKNRNLAKRLEKTGGKSGNR
uniref:Nucleolar GTP-binding protein 2 n=2 Tax=Macrostomum lignano TaxID=282301 RepID=A0A1I8H455_9PLAT